MGDLVPCSDINSCTSFAVRSDLLCKNCLDGLSSHVPFRRRSQKCLWDSGSFVVLNCAVCSHTVCVCQWAGDYVSRMTYVVRNGRVYTTHAWCRTLVVAHLSELLGYIPNATDTTNYIINNPDEVHRRWGA